MSFHLFLHDSHICYWVFLCLLLPIIAVHADNCGETATRRSTRNDLPKLSKKALSASLRSIPNSDDASSSDFPEISMISEYTSAKKAVKSRESLSSVATSNNYNEDSGYSTPATSAAVTPAEQSKSSTRSLRHHVGQQPNHDSHFECTKYRRSYQFVFDFQSYSGGTYTRCHCEEWLRS